MNHNFHKIKKEYILKLTNLLTSILKHTGIIFTETINHNQNVNKRNEKKLLSQFQIKHILNFYYKNLNHNIDSIINRRYFLKIIDKSVRIIKIEIF